MSTYCVSKWRSVVIYLVCGAVVGMFSDTLRYLLSHALNDVYFLLKRGSQFCHLTTPPTTTL